MKFSPFHTGMEAPQDVFALRRRVNEPPWGRAGQSGVEWNGVDQSGTERIRMITEEGKTYESGISSNITGMGLIL